MGQEPHDKGQLSAIRNNAIRHKEGNIEDFVLEKGIFANIFEKDIRRVFIYKKSERLAKGIHLIAPAFAESAALRNRIDAIAIGLVDAAILPPAAARAALSRELLALSSMLSIARSGGLLSAMNAELIAHEAHTLLQEVASYEEPRLFLDDAPTLSGIARQAMQRNRQSPLPFMPAPANRSARPQRVVKDTADVSDTKIKDRREAVVSVIRTKGKASIKDISTVIRGISEKTIQRELMALIEEGVVRKEGERRWSLYFLA